MSDSTLHLRSTWYRPSWQGGDVDQPLCCKPTQGWAGPEASALPMSPITQEVDCQLCLHIAKQGRRAVSYSSTEFEGPPRRRNDHIKHLTLIWRHSHGQMFPFCVEQRRAA